MSVRVSSVIVIVAGSLALLGGCAGRDRRPAGAVPGVSPLTEPDFDGFTTRIADRIVQVTRLRGDTGSVRIAGPVVAPGGTEPTETARPFAANLAESLNDRLIGVARVMGPADSAAAASAPGGEVAGLEDRDPPPLRSTLTFTPTAAAAGGRAAQRVVTFALIDARDGIELMRESVPYAATETAVASAPPPTRPRRSAPPRRSRSAESDVSASPEPPQSAPPPVAATVDEPPTRALAAAPPPEPPREPRAEARVEPMPAAEDDEPRRAPRREAPTGKRERLKIDRSGADLGAFITAQMPFHTERTVAGSDGAVVFVNEAAWSRFRLMAQRSVRLRDGRLRVELDVRSRGKRRNAQMRIVFFDEQGQQTEVSPVIPERFMGDYTRTVLFATAGTRSVRYVVLFADD